MHSAVYMLGYLFDVSVLLRLHIRGWIREAFPRRFSRTSLRGVGVSGEWSSALGGARRRGHRSKNVRETFPRHMTHGNQTCTCKMQTTHLE